MDRVREQGPQIGAWGAFDDPDYDTLLGLRILERELLRRLPLARVHVSAPLGLDSTGAFERGRPALPLGPWTASWTAKAAENLDLVVIAGRIYPSDDAYARAVGISNEQARRLRPSAFFVEALGAELERSVPVVWHAVSISSGLGVAEAARVRAGLGSKRLVSVTEDASRDRLLAAGGRADVVVLPEPALLAPRIFTAELLQKRVDYLRALGCYPPREAPVLVQADAPVEIPADPAGPPVVFARLGPRGVEGEQAERRADPVFRLPNAVTLEDCVAAIANARAFAGTSVGARATARAFGVPVTPETSRPGRANTGEAEGLLDEHFDRLADLAERRWSERVSREPSPAELARALVEADKRYDSLDRAYAARGERLVEERLQFAEIVDALETGDSGDQALELAEVRNRLETLDAAAAAARAERDALEAQLEQTEVERERLRSALVRLRIERGLRWGPISTLDRFLRGRLRGNGNG